MTTTEQQTRTLREQLEPAIQLAETLGCADALVGPMWLSTQYGHVGSRIRDVLGKPERVDEFDAATWHREGMTIRCYDWPREKCPECGGTGRK